MGWVGAALTVAGGGDYGDETVDTMRGHVWEGNHEVGDNILQQYSLGYCEKAFLPCKH